MTKPLDHCHTCGVRADEFGAWGALIVSWQRWGDRFITWCLCLSCERKERQR
jgi:hypothetical protein